ncbi:oxygenase MpaB family protein [Azospirillum griseum]|uniref:DUF2236 domain-containing protein n=1 Tax=Azospirillum griseum TaxID=2496639 RepID=A0A3S0K7A5_9PROT|nr:oxygenase MpaB family protein [Azospirillum griseum]RTR23589.1 DUF2236 domain-containing protein [Azospirillum griseum]
MIIPSDYRTGFATAQRIDADLATLYVRHTTIGDPAADAVMEAFRAHPGPLQRDWMRRGIEDGPSALSDAPDAVRAFFADIETPPPWFSPDRALPGCRAFHRNSEMFLGAFVAAVLVEGFSTLISKSFSITGRLVDQGVRRLKQNNLHLVEIFLPGGLERHGEGWKLSVRIRLIHARIRHLLAESEDWDAAAWGTPLSSAHIAYATAAFSGLLLERARALGVTLSAEESESFMMIWRYSGQLMGVDPALLFTDLDSALRLQRVGALCEPPPDIESIILANGLINSAPVVAGITAPHARKALVRRIYTISRALIGDELADRLRYPPGRTFGVLAALRWTNRMERWLYRAVPTLGARRRVGQFQRMLDVSFHEASGISYRMPERLHAEKDAPL